MKRKQLIPLSVVSFILALMVLLGSSLRANASVDPFSGYRQSFSVTLISDLSTIRGMRPGYVVACAENNKLYFVKPYGSYPINPPYVIGGQDGIILVDLVTAIATSAIDPGKLTLAPANYVLSGTGSANAWMAMTDAIHGNRGGGSLHSAVSDTGAGFAPAITAAYRVLLSITGGTASVWGQISDAFVSGLSWGKLTSLPTLTTTLPLTGGGTLGALTLGINAATTSAAGSMSGSDKAKVDGIPTATVGNAGKILTPSPTYTGTYVLSAPSALGINTGGGSAYVLPKRPEDGFALVDSHVSDDGSLVTVSENLKVAAYGNVLIDLQNTSSTHSYWGWQAAAPSGTTGALILWEGTNAIQYTTQGGYNGFGGITDPTANVDVSSFRLRTGAAAGYLMAGDANGLASWNSISGLGLLQNGASYYYVSDGLKLSATGVTDIYGGTLGYPTQATTGNGKDINIRAQDSTIGNGGNINIYSGQGVTRSVDGVISLTAGASGSGTINLAAGRVIGPSGVIDSSPVPSSDSVIPIEDVQWSTTDTIGNVRGEIDFTSMNGSSGIPSGAYSIVYTIVARGTRFTGTIIYATTWVKAGSLNRIENIQVANPQGVALDTSSSSDSNKIALLIWPPGASGSDVVRWVVKTQIIKY
jgi:hypothetical protein